MTIYGQSIVPKFHAVPPFLFSQSPQEVEGSKRFKVPEYLFLSAPNQNAHGQVIAAQSCPSVHCLGWQDCARLNDSAKLALSCPAIEVFRIEVHVPVAHQYQYLHTGRCPP